MIKLVNLLKEQNPSNHLVFEIRDRDRNVIYLHITPTKAYAIGTSGMGSGFTNLFLATTATSRKNMDYMQYNKYIQQKLLQLAKSYKHDLNKIQKYLESGSNNHPWLWLGGRIIKAYKM